MTEAAFILWHFVRTRWLPPPSPRARLRRFLRRTVRECPHYRGVEPELENFPLLTKRSFLEHFGELNRPGITLGEATAAALRAERERDFQPTLRDGVTVGLSSGTSGSRHVFLAGRRDRCRWAGQILARMLSAESLRQLVDPWAPPLRIALFLRANSNLYTTLRSRRVRFDYHDLTRPFEDLMMDLETRPPHILVAPATVLAEIARRVLRQAASGNPFSGLRQVISVAEVLDRRDRDLIERAFSLPVGQIYQAAEGFLGSTCAQGRIHLNEDHMHIERRWMDDRRERFQPVITDFSRHTQWFVRHLLTDVLRPAATPCPCGARTTSLEGIEGREEEILWSREVGSGRLGPVFPDVLRQALYAMEEPPEQYRIEQHGERWVVQLSPCTPPMETAVRAALASLLEGLRLKPPPLQFETWYAQPPGEKQKRLRCVTPPP
jgi:putative adenylate-forming enzyme